MTALYNEIEPFAAQWTENLIAARHVAPGLVDRRSIAELAPEDVINAVQGHFFSGIAVWSAATRAAGWPDDAELWTGSCPCQPFSAAGRGKGFADDRHLWPEWFRLIRECRPPVVVGEQVASKAGLGWLDAVQADLEAEGYAFGAADTCAASVGAPHIRQRLYFVALAHGERLERVRVQLQERRSRAGVPEASRGGEAGSLGHASPVGHRRSSQGGWQEVYRAQQSSEARELADSSQSRRRESQHSLRPWSDEPNPVGRSDSGILANVQEVGRRQGSPLGPGGGGRAPEGARRSGPADDLEIVSVADMLGQGLEVQREQPARRELETAERGRETILLANTTGARPEVTEDRGAGREDALPGSRDLEPERGRPTDGYWRSCDRVYCRDGKWRPVEPGLEPLAHGITGRVGKLRAFGNSIVLPQAKVFLESVIDVITNQESH